MPIEQHRNVPNRSHRTATKANIMSDYSFSPTPDDIANAYATGQRVQLSTVIIAGQPRSYWPGRVILAIDDTVWYTVDGVWFSTLTRSETADWNLIVDPVTPESAPALGAPVRTPDGVGEFAGVTGHLYAVTYPDGIPAIGMAPGSTLGYAPADVAPVPALPSYSFYVGETYWHDAHVGSKAAEAMPGELRIDAHDSRERLYGVWEGKTERVAVYRLPLADDAVAQRIAYAIAILTGNECVMVTRDAFKGESDRAMNSTARFRVSARIAEDGNRTLYDGTVPGRGYRFEPDVKGDEIAYLVHSDATVSAVL
jgi:hypothetical protein